MSGQIIPMRDAGCAETQELLPWLAAGTVSPVEEARARAHLAGCLTCQGEFEMERLIAGEVAALPTQTDQAWAAFRPRLETRKPFWSSRAFVGWAIAAQVLLLIGGVAVTQHPRVASYHALGAKTAPASADMLVMFRPGATEAQIRSALRAADARLVDGPTEADAYLLSTPVAGRERALAQLSANREVTLAQPLDPGGGS